MQSGQQTVMKSYYDWPHVVPFAYDSYYVRYNHYICWYLHIHYNYVIILYLLILLLFKDYFYSAGLIGFVDMYKVWNECSVTFAFMSSMPLTTAQTYQNCYCCYHLDWLVMGNKNVWIHNKYPCRLNALHYILFLDEDILTGLCPCLLYTSLALLWIQLHRKRQSLLFTYALLTHKTQASASRSKFTHTACRQWSWGWRHICNATPLIYFCTSKVNTVLNLY